MFTYIVYICNIKVCNLCGFIKAVCSNGGTHLYVCLLLFFVFFMVRMINVLVWRHITQNVTFVGYKALLKEMYSLDEMQSNFSFNHALNVNI